MPVYAYRCQACGKPADHCVSYDSRTESQDCPFCEAEKSCKYEGVNKITPTMNPVRPRRDDGRIIWDEREVHADSDEGENWRDEGTNRRPGGAGDKIYFH